jgi:hypothetical protein
LRAEVVCGGAEGGLAALIGEVEEAELQELFLRGHGHVRALGGEGPVGGRGGGGWIFDVVLVEEDAAALVGCPDGSVEGELHDGIAG